MHPLVASMLIASQAWTPSSQGDNCQYFVGERVGDYAPVRAECDWAVPPEKLHGLLAKFQDHDLYFDSVAQCDSAGKAEGYGALFHQVHQAPGISDREVIMQMWVEPISGGARYHWTKYKDQGLLEGDRIEVAATTGHWEITAGKLGHSKVIYQLHYDPAGSVPAFLVRWFQTTGLETFVGQLHSYVADTAAPQAAVSD